MKVQSYSAIIQLHGVPIKFVDLNKQVPQYPNLFLIFFPAVLTLYSRFPEMERLRKRFYYSIEFRELSRDY